MMYIDRTKINLKAYRKKALVLGMGVIIVLIILVSKMIPSDQYKEMLYMCEEKGNSSWILKLDNEGKFFLYDSSSSIAYIDNMPGNYTWENELLVLKYADAEDVLYFEKNGDALIYQKERSLQKRTLSYLSFEDGTTFVNIYP